MRDVENILQVAEARPDYLGFIFYEQSPRFVGSTFSIPSGMEEIQRVGVFVNESLENVSKNVNQYQLDLVQLHGHESSEYCAALRAQNIKVIKAFGIDDQFDFNNVTTY
jgi:phosphoribosylanthranilate isomerase